MTVIITDTISKMYFLIFYNIYLILNSCFMLIYIIFMSSEILKLFSKNKNSNFLMCSIHKYIIIFIDNVHRV